MSTSKHSAFQSQLFYSLVAEMLKEVERELIEIKSVRFLCNYPWPPGKRLRPITFLLSNLSVRVEKPHNVYVNGRELRLAAAIELFHEASLIHDDLVDRSYIRRGVPSMQVVNGDGLALLIGDYMIFRGLKLILDSAETKNDIILAKELANTGLQIAHGEADQLDRYLNKRGLEDRMSLDNYLNVIAKKTAAFFAGCAEVGATLAGANAEQQEVYREFGMNMGIVFQIMDDLMDIFGDPKIAHKTLRNNISEGTITLPMIHAWELYSNDWAICRVASGKPLDQRLQDSLYQKLASKEVLTLSEKTMNRYVVQTEKYLSQMPNNIYRLGLIDLFDYIRHCPWGGLEKKINKKKKNLEEQ